MKRILVTGGAGFIGSNLCARLVKDESIHICHIYNFEKQTSLIGRGLEYSGIDITDHFEFKFHR